MAMSSTSVIFRKFKDGDIIAFLPEVEANPGMVMSYMHMGQHSEADRNISSYTKLASESEYANLEKELTGIYGSLRVITRLPASR